MNIRSVDVFQSQAHGTQANGPSPTYPQGVRVHTPEEWTVEAITDDGAIETTIFRGHRSQERAEMYRDHRYHSVALPA